jgi:hypothetical protein
MSEAIRVFDEAALLERLSRALKKWEQEVVFLVGALYLRRWGKVCEAYPVWTGL